MRSSTISMLAWRQFVEHKRIYGIGALVLFALLMFMFLIIHQWQDSFTGAVQNGVFIIGLFISGALFTSTMFSELSSPRSTIWMLSIPATHAEKVMLSVLLSVPFFLLMFLSIYYLADIVYLNTMAGAGVGLLDLTKNGFYQFIYQYLIFNGIILLGAVFFNRYSLIKTILVGVVFIAIANFLNNTLLSLLIPEMTILSSTLFDGFLFSYQGENIAVSLSASDDRITAIFVRVILPVSLWYSVWLKLKEKEV